MCTNEKKHATIVASTPDRILHIRSPQNPPPLETHPHRTSPTQTAAANQLDIESCFFSFLHINIVTWRWPSRPKHVVAIAKINRITRQLCFWRTLFLSFNIRKHNGDDEPEDYICYSQIHINYTEQVSPTEIQFALYISRITSPDDKYLWWNFWTKISSDSRVLDCGTEYKITANNVNTAFSCTGYSEEEGNRICRNRKIFTSQYNINETQLFNVQ
jgi:hypothetical protein